MAIHERQARGLVPGNGTSYFKESCDRAGSRRPYPHQEAQSA